MDGRPKRIKKFAFTIVFVWTGPKVGYTTPHLHQRIAEHKYSAIGKHLLDAHGDKNLINVDQFRVLKKFHGKFDCLVYDMLFIKELRPSLKSQSDVISAKLFVWLVAYFVTSLY